MRVGQAEAHGGLLVRHLPNDTGGDSKSPDKKKQKKDDATVATLGAKRLFAEVSGPRGTAIWDLGGSGDCGSNGKQKWKVRGGNP